MKNRTDEKNELRAAYLAYRAEWRRTLKKAFGVPIKSTTKSEKRLYRKVAQTMETKYNAPFQPIKNVPRLTGFSEHFIREGVKSGTIPHVRVGVKILVDVPKFLAKMHEQSGTGDVNEQA